jgi:hypothetical protein
MEDPVERGHHPTMPRSSAPTHRRNGSDAGARLQRRQQAAEPDVFLSVPDLHVDELELDVENLEAHLALKARLANLLELQAGADVTIEKVKLDIKGVAAKAMLKVRLENVYAILDRALSTLDRNPQILEGVIDTVDDAVGPGGLIDNTLEGVSRTVRTVRRPRRLPSVNAVAAAAGVLGGVALAAHSNGGVEKTLKELTS